MTTLTCPECNEEWEFEAGLAPPLGWAHYCSETAIAQITARDVEDWIPQAVKDLKGRTGPTRYMRLNSATIRGAHLALDEEEFDLFLGMVKRAQDAPF